MRESRTRTFLSWWGGVLLIAGCGDSTPDPTTPDASSGGNMSGSGGAGGASASGSGGSAGSDATGSGGGATAGSGGVAPSDGGSVAHDGDMIDADSTSDAATGPITIFAGGGKPTGIALSATAVYWADDLRDQSLGELQHVRGFRQVRRDVQPLVRRGGRRLTYRDARISRAPAQPVGASNEYTLAASSTMPCGQ